MKKEKKVKMWTLYLITKLLNVVNVQYKKTEIFEANKSKGFINSFVVVIKWYQQQQKKSLNQIERAAKEEKNVENMSSIIITNK